MLYGRPTVGDERESSSRSGWTREPLFVSEGFDLNGLNDLNGLDHLNTQRRLFTSQRNIGQ